MSEPIDPLLLELFAEESEGQLSALSEGLVALEGASDTKAVLDELMRAAHSLKGGARIVGLEPVVKIAHALEDYFVAALSGALVIEPQQVDALLGAVDFLQQLAHGGSESLAELEARVPEQLAVLDALRRGEVPVAPPPQAQPAVLPAETSAAAVDAIDPTLLEMFAEEAAGQLAALSDGLVSFEQAPDNGAAVEELMRAAHSLKGGARIVGLDPVVKLAHALEDYFVAVQQGDLTISASAIDGLLAAVDFLTRMTVSAGSVLEAMIAELPGWLARVESLRQGNAASPAAAEPAPAPAPAAVPQTDELESPGDMAPGEPIDPVLLELFAEEAETQLLALSEGLVALDATTDSKAALDELMRAAHSLKGAARIVGFDPVVKVSHAMEDYLVAALQGEVTVDPTAVDTLLTGSDLLGRMARGGGEDPVALAVESSGLIAALNTLRQGKVLETPSVAAHAATQDASSIAEESDLTTSVARAAQAEKPAAAARTAVDKGIRITTEALARLTALAAETVVEAGRMERLVEEGDVLRERHRELRDAMGTLRSSLQDNGAAQVEIERMTQLIEQLEECRQLLRERDEKLEQFSLRSTQLASRLSRETLASRMRPFGTIVRGFPRLVRDLARELEKNCRLIIAGEGTQIDREVLEQLEAPLNHIVRNALDHGMESPSQREAAGKPAQGTLRLTAAHQGGRLRVSVADDGRGIDHERLRVAIVERGLESAQNAARLSAEELYEFLFLPGFSTAAKVSEISGRGVGLDAVRSMVQSAGGAVILTSSLGVGTTFNLELPITRAVARVLLVDVCGDLFAVPLARVERVLHASHDQFRTVEGRPYVALEGSDVALIPAAEVLDLEADAWSQDRCAVLVIAEGARRYGLVVDKFVGETVLVVRPLDPRLGELPDIAAYSTNDAGKIILFLDVDQMVRAMDSLITEGRLRRPGGDAEDGLSPLQKILVVDDSLTVRQAERQLLENAGYRVDVAVDGVEAWSALRLGAYDLLVSDVDMPRMNGIELVRRVRSDPRLEKLPAVVVSYKDREEDRLRGLEAGANHYLTKGGLLDTTLLEVVADLIGEPGR